MPDKIMTPPSTAAANCTAAEIDSEWEIGPRPEKPLAMIGLVWQRRRLFPWLARLAVKMAYQKAILGIAWLFIRPFVMVLVATIVFREMLGVRTGDVPYPLFVLASLALWILFQRGVAWCTRGLNRHKRVITRFPIPRLVPAATSIIPALIESATVFLCFILAIWFFWAVSGTLYVQIGWHTLALIPVILATMVVVWSITLFTSLWFLQARDTWYILRYVLTALMFASPVLYPISALPAFYQNLALINPLTSLINAYRWVLFAGPEPNLWVLGGHFVLISLCVVGGIRYFLRENVAVFDQI